MLWIELLILLACILIGVRLGGIALGAVAGPRHPDSSSGEEEDSDHHDRKDEVSRTVHDSGDATEACFQEALSALP